MRERGFAVGGEEGSGKRAEWLGEQSYRDVLALYGMEPDAAMENFGTIENALEKKGAAPA